MEPTQPNPLVCPHCQQIDQVSKVTAVVSGGVSAGVYAAPMRRGGYAALPGASQTAQSMRLAAPKEPVFRPSINVWVIVIASIVFVILSLSFANWSIDIVLITLVCALIVWLIWLSRRDKRRRALFLTHHPQWEQAMAKWNALYYCGRCDGVFLPDGASGFVPIDQMGAFLYS